MESHIFGLLVILSQAMPPHFPFRPPSILIFFLYALVVGLKHGGSYPQAAIMVVQDYDC